MNGATAVNRTDGLGVSHTGSEVSKPSPKHRVKRKSEQSQMSPVEKFKARSYGWRNSKKTKKKQQQQNSVKI